MDCKEGLYPEHVLRFANARTIFTRVSDLVANECNNKCWGIPLDTLSLLKLYCRTTASTLLVLFFSVTLQESGVSIARRHFTPLPVFHHTTDITNSVSLRQFAKSDVGLYRIYCRCLHVCCLGAVTVLRKSFAAWSGLATFYSTALACSFPKYKFESY